MNGDDYATIWDAMEITRLEGNELDVQFVCASELLDEIAKKVNEFQMEDNDGAKDS